MELKCPPEVEATVFENSGSLDLDAIAGGVHAPTLWLAATRGHFSFERAQQLGARMARARVEALDAGHLAPMEAPERVIAALRGFCL